MAAGVGASVVNVAENALRAALVGAVVCFVGGGLYTAVRETSKHTQSKQLRRVIPPRVAQHGDVFDAFAMLSEVQRPDMEQLGRVARRVETLLLLWAKVTACETIPMDMLSIRGEAEIAFNNFAKELQQFFRKSGVPLIRRKSPIASVGELLLPVNENVNDAASALLVHVCQIRDSIQQQVRAKCGAASQRAVDLRRMRSVS